MKFASGNSHVLLTEASLIAYNIKEGKEQGVINKKHHRGTDLMGVDEKFRTQTNQTGYKYTHRHVRLRGKNLRRGIIQFYFRVGLNSAAVWGKRNLRSDRNVGC